MNTLVEEADLEARVVAAFSGTATSEAIAGLIEEVRTAANDASQRADVARTRALDPALLTTDVAAARAEMEDSAFIKDRMDVAATRLTERLREVRRIEEDARRLAVYDEVVAERDELADELSREYPALVNKLTELLSRVAANTTRIEHINARGLPADVKPILVAELLARDLGGFVKKGIEAPSVVRAVRLPAFRFDPHAAFAWPRSGALMKRT